MNIKELKTLLKHYLKKIMYIFIRIGIRKD